jgi:DNA polymerase (family 10)
MKETIGDLDILAASSDPPAVMKIVAGISGVNDIASSGSTKTSLLTREGLRVDVRVVAPDEFGAALQYFTGSKEHNVRVREIAVKQGYKLSEYGLFRVSDNEKVAGETEEQVYGALGMQWPPPTMREDRGEIALCLKGELPRVVQLDDIRGDLHSHTTYSDGSASVMEMAETAAGLGRSYLALTDHFEVTYVKSHTIDTVARQAEEIRMANKALEGRIRILQGLEADIGPEGELNLPGDVLDLVDLVIVSIHQGFRMGIEAMTARVIKGLSHPRATIFGHPTGRWLGQRPGAEFDFDAVFQAAARNSVALEVNSNPARLDLKDDHLRLARKHGCRFCINTDSHKPSQLARMNLGVGMAQRGWLGPGEVINCRPVDELYELLNIVAKR